MAPPPFVTRVRLQSYKSIKACDVALGPLAILVGPNGSGKSNFLDALRFTAEALSTTLDFALRERGGLGEVRRKSPPGGGILAIRLDLRLPGGVVAHYAFKIAVEGDRGYRVVDEECLVGSTAGGASDDGFRVRDHHLVTNVEERLPAAVEDRLYLVSASNVAQFRPVFDALTAMAFYNLNPSAIRELQQPDAGLRLRRDGDNLASVLGHLAQDNRTAHGRVVEYLRQFLPGIEDVSRLPVGPVETIEFRQRVAEVGEPRAFLAANMSDGTLRGLGVLVALLQANGTAPTLVGIEEPEMALHPAAVGVLLDAVKDASRHTQVVLTSHSPDLLDREDLSDSSILAVAADDGVTTIGPVSDVGRSALRDRLFTAGELLRMNQLVPSEAAHQTSRTETAELFEL